MRVSIIEQAKIFITQSKENNNYVYLSKDIKLALKNYLISNNLLYSPIRGIFILKSSTTSNEEVLEKYKYAIISKLNGVLTWDFALHFYLWSHEKIKEFTIINQSKNFITYLWDKKQYRVIFKMSKIKRNIHIINIEWSKLEIESPLSFIVNNFFQYKGNKKFEEFILKQDINEWEIIDMVKKGFKLSGFSKLAIFYKNNKHNWKFKLIQRVLFELGKKIDRRNNKIEIKNKTVQQAVDNIKKLDSLF